MIRVERDNCCVVVCVPFMADNKRQGVATGIVATCLCAFAALVIATLDSHATAQRIDPADTPYVLRIDSEEYGAMEAPVVTAHSTGRLHVVWQTRFGETCEAWASGTVVIEHEDDPEQTQ